MNFEAIHEAYAYDLLLWHNYAYRIECFPELTDSEFDELEAWSVSRWPWLAIVGSDNADDYPLYIQLKRRPMEWQRAERDARLRDIRIDWELDNLD